MGEREKEIERHVLPVAAAGVRGTIKNDETRPSEVLEVTSGESEKMFTRA